MDGPCVRIVKHERFHAFQQCPTPLRLVQDRVPQRHNDGELPLRKTVNKPLYASTVKFNRPTTNLNSGPEAQTDPTNQQPNSSVGEAQTTQKKKNKDKISSIPEVKPK